MTAERELPFSTLVRDALQAWLRGQLVDTWIEEYQSSHGLFTEAELEALALEVGVPYVPPAPKVG